MQKILLVDGAPQSMKTLRIALSSQGHSLYVAANGIEGMLAVRDWQPDLVIMDVSLPKVDGIEFCRQLREVSGVPLIFLSVCTDELIKVEALDAGVDDYVTKPFSIHELHARIRAQLRRHSAHPSEPQRVLSVGDFRIDVAQHRVAVRGQLIRLTPLQFNLLLCFAKHAGQILTHRVIFQDVWGLDQDRPEHVRVHIGQLRKKIEISDAPQYIVTEPWIGYRFCADGNNTLLEQW